MSFRLRSSKYRHVFGSPFKKESCYESIKISNNAHDNNFCAVNPLYISAVTEAAGGGAFVVLPLEKYGRVDINTPKVCGHTGPVLDIKWNPFNDNVIASASEDSTVKLWQIPEGGPESNISDWLVDLHGHTRRVGYIEWHPTAENILLSAGYDQNCILWNVETAEPINIISVHPEHIFSLAWNHDGSLFATTCKDKQLRIVDPRQGNIVSECSSHQGNKATKVTFLGNKNKIFTTGSSRMCDRQYGIWDMRNMAKPLRMDEIDSSSGIMFIYYDPDTNVVFLAGKGDGNIRYYEIVDEAPHIHYLSQYQSGSPQRGLGIMPKRGLDTSRCEMVRFYKLHTGKSLIEPISMIVPRKSEMFQDDIYPPTASAVPSLSADEWIAGNNREPILMSLKDRQILATPKSHAGKAVQRKKPTSVDIPTNQKTSLILKPSIHQQQKMTMDSSNQRQIQTVKLINQKPSHSSSSTNQKAGLITRGSNQKLFYTGKQVSTTQHKVSANVKEVINNGQGKTSIGESNQTLAFNKPTLANNQPPTRQITQSNVHNQNNQSARPNVKTIARINTRSIHKTNQNITFLHSSESNDTSRLASPRNSNANRSSNTNQNDNKTKKTSSNQRAPLALTTKVIGPSFSKTSTKKNLMSSVPNVLKPKRRPSSSTGSDVVAKGTVGNLRNQSSTGSDVVTKRTGGNRRNQSSTGSDVVTEGTVGNLRNQFSYTTKNKDGNIVPTITTYKAMKRGQSVTEPPESSVKRSSPLTKAMTFDHSDRSDVNKIPASVRNIAKLSALDQVNENTPPPNLQQQNSIDVQNRIGMFENKKTSSVPSSPEKRWSSNYQGTVKTEVTSPTNANSHSPIQRPGAGFHSPKPEESQLSSPVNTTMSPIAYHQPTFPTTTDSNQTTNKLPSLLSIENGAFASDDSDDAMETNAPQEHEGGNSIITQRRKQRGYNYRRRRENKILNESSDMETFTTPPTSPASVTGRSVFEGGASTPALATWNENPLFSTEVGASTGAVDISALDDALNDFEELSKTFHPSTDQQQASMPDLKGTSSSYIRSQSSSTHQLVSSVSSSTKQSVVESSSNNRTKVQKTARRDRDVHRERELSKSKPELSSKSVEYSSKNEMSINNVDSKSTSLLHDYSSSSLPSESPAVPLTFPSDPLSFASEVSPVTTISGASYCRPSPDRTSPDTRLGSQSGIVGGESREMIDMMSEEAPDNTLIKPSKLRASMRSKRRPTQEVESIISPDLKSKISGDNIGSGGRLGNAIQRVGSFRERVTPREKTPDTYDDNNFRRGNSMRERFRTKEVIAIEMDTTTDSKQTTSRVAMNSNAGKLDLNRCVSPSQVSRPLQLALDMETGDSSNNRNSYDKIHSSNSITESNNNKVTRQDSFKSSTRMNLHSPSSSPVMKSPPQPVHMYSQNSPLAVHMHSSSTSPVQMSSPRVHPYSPTTPDHQNKPLLFSTTSVEDKSPDKIVFSPTIGAGEYSSSKKISTLKSPLLGRKDMSDVGGAASSASMEGSADHHFSSSFAVSPTPVTRKIHVKKVWSPRSPAMSRNNHFVYENGDATTTMADNNHIPNTDPELRKAYFRQLEEIESYKQQITLKDKRIRQLEEELKLLRVAIPGDPLEESIC